MPHQSGVNKHRERGGIKKRGTLGVGECRLHKLAADVYYSMPDSAACNSLLSKEEEQAGAGSSQLSLSIAAPCRWRISWASLCPGLKRNSQQHSCLSIRTLVGPLCYPEVSCCPAIRLRTPSRLMSCATCGKLFNSCFCRLAALQHTPPHTHTHCQGLVAAYG